MIEDISASVEIWGDHFSSKEAEERTGLSFSQKNELGDIGSTGKYKNKALPYGSASLEAPSEVEPFERILWLANALKGKVEILEECRADDIRFSIGYFYKDQCNCVLSTEEIKAIADIGLDFCFSCYDIVAEE